MNFLKSTISYLLIVSILFSVNACYVSQTKSSPKIVEGSGQLVNKHYNVEVSRSPSRESGEYSARAYYQPEYKYDTRVEISKKYKHPNMGAIFSRIMLPIGVGYYAYTEAPDGKVFSKETPNWIWITMGLCTVWMFSSFGTGQLNKIKYKQQYEPGPVKYQKEDEIPLTNTSVDVIANDISIQYPTNSYGELRVDIGDYKLPAYQYHRDVNFNFSNNGNPLGEINLNTESFMNTYTRINVPFADIKSKDLSASNTVGKALFGMESEMLNTNSDDSWSYVSFGKKQGWVENLNLENFYAIDYKLQTPDVNKSVSMYVEKMLEPWQEKGRYEKLTDYQTRVNEVSRRKKIEEFTAEGMNLIATTFVDIDKSYAKLDYDTESEVFRIQFPELNPIYVPVPIREASHFETNFQGSTLSDIKYAFDGSSFAISYLEISNSEYPREYVYDSNNPINFKASRIVYNFKPVELNLQKFDFNESTTETYDVVEVGVSDVDTDIPKTDQVNKHAIAVVIGNKDYANQDVPSVDYALNDAQAMKKYLVNAFGFKEENILYFENATQGNFNSVFGSESNYKGRLYDLVIPDESDVFVFYSGHGAPDLDSKTGYFVPVDCDPAAVALNGYSTEVFYRNLSQIPYKSLTVVLDACFSGASEKGMLIRNASPIFINAENKVLNDEKSVVITSSEGDQISSWYPEKYHSLMTYYFLKALQGQADENKDGDISVIEIGAYLKGNISPMSRRLHRRDQNPQINGIADKVILNLEKDK
ncbi:caspase family protein [Chondrinema litorale]|uniref:caspase family protein n=1 Tax=Chondrinema litorale TaxID=2994555 RepID=UPI00254384A2|nr:caspase family protein [Chondrinema litorale]UZR94928.1 caspase family protein [Chondrinema litorale]